MKPVGGWCRDGNRKQRAMPEFARWPFALSDGGSNETPTVRMPLFVAAEASSATVHGRGGHATNAYWAIFRCPCQDMHGTNIEHGMSRLRAVAVASQPATIDRGAVAGGSPGLSKTFQRLVARALRISCFFGSLYTSTTARPGSARDVLRVHGFSWFSNVLRLPLARIFGLPGQVHFPEPRWSVVGKQQGTVTAKSMPVPASRGMEQERGDGSSRPALPQG
jgi:hypothetical protein